MDIYTVTYCTMDSDVGANPLRHACILLSRYDEKTRKLEVIENWGFYGLPTTMSGPWLRKLKILVKLDVDLSGNHGILRHEEVRFLDLGCGLHGVTFELTKEKFAELQARCRKEEAEQYAAINEIAEPLNLPAKPSDQSRIYPYEDYSYHLFALEAVRAKAQKRNPRLLPFELGIFPSANTCKAHAIKLLDGIITPQQVQRIRGFHPSIPRFSGKQEKIYLHSSGPMREHVKSNGDIVHFRDANDPEVKLHWTVPPQEIETLSGEVKDLFAVHQDHSDEVKQLISRLQKLEWLFINARFDEHMKFKQEELIQYIRAHYECFSLIKAKQIKLNSSTLTNLFLWSLGMPRDLDEMDLLELIDHAKQLLNNFYHAIIDKWDDMDEPETMATFLPREKQKMLCNILGRSYVELTDMDEMREHLIQHH